jgi:hypothetical protein
MRTLPGNDECEGLVNDGIDPRRLPVVVASSVKSSPKPVVTQAREPRPSKPVNKPMPTVVDKGWQRVETPPAAKAVPTLPAPLSGDSGPQFPFWAIILVVTVVIILSIIGR